MNRVADEAAAGRKIFLVSFLVVVDCLEDLGDLEENRKNWKC